MFQLYKYMAVITFYIYIYPYLNTLIVTNCAVFFLSGVWPNSLQERQQHFMSAVKQAEAAFGIKVALDAGPQFYS